ncbi:MULTISPECIES: protein-L-isoaspartate(D-aspartate) O-methyltransferase [Phenylobacterium]|uniref:Protein-L-isoaspartate O-methyltransferase n=1 Tax=Phenylobacterium koreense TaxID=266125 RepID=A0ABV2EJW3_9CAUL
MIDMPHARALMVERQLLRRNVHDPAVLKAMGEVPREAFVPEALQDFAYDDAPLPIDAGQTISQPYIVAAMVEAAALKPKDTVLEVGAGSGYAAAVMGAIARRVDAIERHENLAQAATERLKRLGIDNVEIHCGDGSLGLPQAAPFDAILVAAAGPRPPESLKAQLKPGGRLVMPVGEPGGEQRLVRLTRTSAGDFEQEDLGGVGFVPLIGQEGWGEERASAQRQPAEPPKGEPHGLALLIREAAEPLPAPEDAAFGAAFDRFAQARVVLLGEASHGTSEFYRARAAISRRLIGEHGFRVVALEADWPDAATLDRYVRGQPQSAESEAPFLRFPTWMWRNREFAEFVRWLRDWNEGRPADDQVSLHGLDLYSLSASIRAVLDYLDRTDPPAAQVARERYGCLTPWAKEPQAYGRMALSEGYARCEAAVMAVLRDLLERRLADGSDALDAAANARLVKNAEAYYRAIYYGAAESWNLRDTHMFETLEQVLAARGAGAKAVVWAHNSHIGDASKTEMGRNRGELNIGQLCRERFGPQAALVGMGTHAGTVACATDWDGPLEIKQIRPSLAGSYERLAHEAGLPRFLLDLRSGVHETLREALAEPRLERFIGVIYRQDTERLSHYSAASLAGQFDAYVWFDETGPVDALPAPPPTGPDETYPFGL